jgi:hypothetical protein
MSNPLTILDITKKIRSNEVLQSCFEKGILKIEMLNLPFILIETPDSDLKDKCSIELISLGYILRESIAIQDQDSVYVYPKGFYTLEDNNYLNNLI